MPISGNSAANGAVSDVVSSRYELVSPKRYAKAARKLGAKSKNEKDIRKVSKKLDIDALVHGEFVRRGKRKYELRLSLRAGASGEEFESVTIKLRSKKLSRSDRSKIKEKLYEALSEVDTWGEDADADMPEKVSRSRRNKHGSSDEERERARKIREKNQDKERRDDDKRIARAEEKAEKRSDKEERRESKSSKKKRDDADDDDDDDDHDRRSKSSTSSKSKSKSKSKSPTSSEEDDEKDDKKRAKKDEDDRRAKKDADDKRAKTAAEEKRAKKEKDESYKVITVRGEDGQAQDTESPF